MPWDGTELRVTDLESGAVTTLAGSVSESVLQPEWVDDATLTMISAIAAAGGTFIPSPCRAKVGCFTPRMPSSAVRSGNSARAPTGHSMRRVSSRCVPSETTAW